MAHRYWRIRITRAWTTQITAMEIELRATTGGADQTPSIGGTAFANSSLAGTAPENAFDDDGVSFWAVTSTTTVNSMNIWIGYDFGPGNAVDVREFSWTIGATASRNPRDCVLEYSDDNSNWYAQGQFTDMAGGAVASTTIYTVALPLDTVVNSVKAGYEVVLNSYDNGEVSVVKEGTQLVVSGLGDAAVKVGTSLALQPTESAYVSRVSSFLVAERQPDVRLSRLAGYVVFRPIPPPPRKTIVIVGPGTNFGGTGLSAELSGTVLQPSNVTGKISLPQRLKGSSEQESLVNADLFVDNGSVDHFLVGVAAQTSNVYAGLNIPHYLSGSVEQESPVTSDLFVDDTHEDHFLVGTATQATPTTGGLYVVQRISGHIVQSSLVSGVFDVSVNLSGTSTQSSLISADLGVTVALRGETSQYSPVIAHLELTHNMLGVAEQVSTVSGSLAVGSGTVSFSLLSTLDKLEPPSNLLLSGESGREILSGE